MAEHLHVWIDEPAPVEPARHIGRFSATDQPGGRPRRVSPRDQRPDGLLCRLRQDGQSGDWSASDPDGGPLRIEHGDGDLMIFAPPGESGQDQRAEPASLYRGAGGLGTSTPPGARAGDDLMALRRRAAGDGSFGSPQAQYRRIADFQSYVTGFYERLLRRSV